MVGLGCSLKKTGLLAHGHVSRLDPAKKQKENKKETKNVASFRLPLKATREPQGISPWLSQGAWFQGSKKAPLLRQTQGRQTACSCVPSAMVICSFSWVWLKIKQEGLRRFWSMFPPTRVPFWYRFFEPPPFKSRNLYISNVHKLRLMTKPTK